MSSWTTEDEWPDEGQPNITQTRGAWVRVMNNGDHEVYIDGKFLVSWNAWSGNIAAAAIQAAYDCGFKRGERANMEKVRSALGLSVEEPNQ